MFGISFYIREVLVSDLGPYIGYLNYRLLCFLSVLPVISEVLHLIKPLAFLQYDFKSIIH